MVATTSTPDAATANPSVVRVQLHEGAEPGDEQAHRVEDQEAGRSEDGHERRGQTRVGHGLAEADPLVVLPHLLDPGEGSVEPQTTRARFRKMPLGPPGQTPRRPGPGRPRCTESPSPKRTLEVIERTGGAIREEAPLREVPQGRPSRTGPAQALRNGHEDPGQPAKELVHRFPDRASELPT